MAVRGDWLASLALRAACSLRAQSVQLAVARCRTPVGDSHPPLSGGYKRKKPVLSYELLSWIWRWGGDWLASLALRAACSLRAQSVQLAVARCRTPVGDSHPPCPEDIKEKSPYFRTSSYLEYGGEGGIDSLRSPCGQPVRCAFSLSNWLSPVVEPRSGILIPPVRGI